MRKEAGFTFIEIILYVAIVSIVLSAIIPFAWNVIGGSVKSSAEQEVSSQARFISEKIKYEIRNANVINSPVSGASAGVLNINTPTATIIDLNAGKARISTNGGSSYTNLNSDDTSVTGLTFTSYTSADNKTKNVQFVFTIDDNFGSSRQEYDVPTITVEGDAEVRSN